MELYIFYVCVFFNAISMASACMCTNGSLLCVCRPGRFSDLLHADDAVPPRAPWQATEAGSRALCTALRSLKWPHGHVECLDFCTLTLNQKCGCLSCAVMRDRVPCPLTQASRFKSHHWHVLSAALGEALLAVAEMEGPQLEAMQYWLRTCGYMRQKVQYPLLRPMRHEFVCKTIARREARLPLYACTMVKHSLLHFHDSGGWAESVGTTLLQKSPHPPPPPTPPHPP
jgi:hypothetical protein